MIDIVVPLGVKSGWGNHEELRYALRSAEKFVPGLRRVWVIGHRPPWLDPQYHLPHPDPYKKNKDANLIQKVVRACVQEDLSENFIRMSDDQLFLAPWKAHQYYLEPITPQMFSRHPKKWYDRLKNTCKSLSGIEPLYNFDAHIPILCNRKQFVEVVSQHNYGEFPGMCINTLYMNSCGGEKTQMPPEIRLGVSKPVPIKDLQERSKKALFCNYVDKGISEQFKIWVKSLLSNKSRFEL